MEIFAPRSLRAAPLAFEQGIGNPTLAVVAKVTFHLTPGMVRLAEPNDQEAIVEEDNHWDDDPSRSLRFASDLVPRKARVDVLLDASVQAPVDGSAKVIARFVVGNPSKPLVDKALAVSPPQFLMRDGSVQRDPWPKLLSIRYERAPGGPGTANPAGVSSQGPRDAQGRLVLPSIDMYPGKPTCEPIGIGPIASTWPTRLSRIAGLGNNFSAQDWQRMPFPMDFPWSYFNVAPEDQRIDAILQGDERIMLENIVLNVPQFETQLSGYRPQGYVCRAHGVRETMQWTCDTLWLDTLRMRLFMVWRAHITAEPGQVIIGIAAKSQRLSFEEVLRQSGAPNESAPQPTGVLPKTGRRKGTIKMRDPKGSKMQPLGPDDTQPFPQHMVTKVISPLRKGTQEIPAHGPTSPPLPFVKSALVVPPPIAPPVPVAPPMISAMPVIPLVPEQPRMRSLAELPPSPLVPAPEVRVLEPASLGVLSASNAAAGTPDLGPVKAQVIEPIVNNEAKVKERPREIVELLWYDPAALPRIRRHLAWKKIIADLKPRPSDDDFDGGLPPEQMKAAKDKRDVLGVLARGEVMDLEGIRRAMDMAVLDDGSFVPPYVLTQGTLEFQFDEVETLKAMLLVVAPFVPGDKKLKETVDLINEVMKTPGIERAKRVAEGLTKRLKEAFYQQNRGVGPGYLDEEVEVILVEGRCYCRRRLLVNDFIAGVLVGDSLFGLGSVYVDNRAESVLPMSRRMSSKIIAECMRAPAPQEVALRVLAVAAVCR